MPTPDELEDELRTGLESLHIDVSTKRLEGNDKHAIQRDIDRKLGEWSLMLHEGEQECIRQRKREAEAAHPDLDKDRTIEDEMTRALRVAEDYSRDIPKIKENMQHLRFELVKGIEDINDHREPKVEPIPHPQFQPLHVPVVAGFELTPEQLTPDNASKFFASRDKPREAQPEAKRASGNKPERDLENEP